MVLVKINELFYLEISYKGVSKIVKCSTICEAKIFLDNKLINEKLLCKLFKRKKIDPKKVQAHSLNDKLENAPFLFNSKKEDNVLMYVVEDE